ncbi:MAG: 1,4-dihydroxy-2-naphthoate octaprenyltransferase [Magnetococcales bacterium]|nr:1,4-dihydroxy-2-naphthoate octaprenyltransferase [Magnetococcales bacterium]
MAINSGNIFNIWWQALRPKTLTLAVTPVLVGNALAYAKQGWLEGIPIFLTLIAAISVQVGTNLYNDAADFERGVDKPDRLGPNRVVATGQLSAKIVYRGAHLAFVLAWLAGSYLMWLGGWFIFFIALFSTLAGYAYTAGPKPISTTPFGELTVFLFFGVAAVVGTVYLQTGTVEQLSIIVGALVGMPAAGVLMVNNYRDSKNDSLAGRRTLAIVAGVTGSKIIFTFLITTPYLLGVFIYFTDQLSSAWLCLILLSFYSAFTIIKSFWQTSVSPAFNVILANTAKHQMYFGLLLSISFVLSRLKLLYL